MPVALDVLGAAIFEAAPDPIIVTAADGTIVLVNQQVETVLRYGRAALIGQSVDVLLPERLRRVHEGHRASYGAAPTVRAMGSRARLRARCGDGCEIPVEISLSPVETPAGRFIVAILRDVSERSEQEERLRYLSTHDALTGLYNRAFFEEEVARAERGRHRPIAVLMADLDGLKRVNDTFGHPAGDALLKGAAAVLRSAFRADDVVARLGGDEFAVVWPCQSRAQVESTLERVEAAEREHNARSNAPSVRLSLGVACTGDEGAVTVADALREADTAMYRRKRERTPPR